MDRKIVSEIIDADRFDTGDILSRAKSTLKEGDKRKKVLDITTAKDVFDTGDILSRAKRTLKDDDGRKKVLAVNITALRRGKKKGTKAKRKKGCGCK